MPPGLTDFIMRSKALYATFESRNVDQPNEQPHRYSGGLASSDERGFYLRSATVDGYVLKALICLRVV
ncbi:hypothetical protein CVT26_011674 [Gymnopilus dilepis]|uniref:Uncharacterized protein n=1 Tax=Gymnopilus dilepis TaxID=231916 RepID=A0A409WCA5_9AGAR|nr:hypothetical protein CVT26_011674 [Gymnopilus dilepis]